MAALRNQQSELANGLTGEIELQGGEGGGVTPVSSSTAQSGAAPSSPLVRACIDAGDVFIDRVPLGVRNVDAPNYDPHHVSIGPYHCRQHGVSRQQQKERALTAVFSVAAPAGTEAVAAMAAAAAAEAEAEAEAACIGELTRLKHRARGCYGVQRIGMNSEEFVRMLLLDGCYILAFFGSVYPDAGLAVDTTLTVVRDVFYLAENQIPFFVLEKIVELTQNSNTKSLDDIKEYAVDLLKSRRYSMAAEPMPTAPGNLLHLLRMRLEPREIQRPSSDGERVGRWRTATDYHLAGVKIKRRDISDTGNARCILDVKVSRGGALMIPCLDIDNQLWRLLRNLIALEQQQQQEDPERVPGHVTAYCVFMSQLACETRDVELLMKKKIIDHRHGKGGEVAQCFADLCKGINFDADDPDRNYLRMTWQELEKQYGNFFRRWLAWLWLKYFSNPWLTIGLMAAAIGLACGIIQAIYSVLSYRQGRK